jgi:hypothetical protein
MMDIQYVADDRGNRIAVQIPLAQWEIIKAEIEVYDGAREMAEIMADPDLVETIRRGRDQAGRKHGRRAEEINV